MFSSSHDQLSGIEADKSSLLYTLSGLKVVPTGPMRKEAVLGFTDNTETFEL